MIIVDRRHLKAVFYELEAPKSQFHPWTGTSSLGSGSAISSQRSCDVATPSSASSMNIARSV